jgi:ATP-binding cassette, subfamily B, bacterial
MEKDAVNKKKDTIFNLLKPYLLLVIGLLFLTILSNGLNLVVPKIISGAIDSYTANKLDICMTIIEFFVVSVLIFLFTYLQNIMQVYTSERVAKDLRTKLIKKISFQDYNYVQQVSPSKLLTNLTSDVDSVKTFVSQAISSIISSIFLIFGASVLLFMINWQLALAVLTIMPIIGITFSFVLSKVRKLFKSSQENIDWLNRIINESILGSALVRLLNSQTFEYKKFLEANKQAKEIWLSILWLFASLIPIIIFVSNIAILIILVLWGHFVILGNMTLWDFSAFNGYLSLLIFPVIIIGFMSWVIAQASASYERILEVINAPVKEEGGQLMEKLSGEIVVENVSLKFWEKYALKDISFLIQPKTRTAIIGPTTAGKTQLLYILTWLIEASSGTVQYDKKDIHEYDKKSFHEQIGLVFQDSILFNLTLRENIAFSNRVDERDIAKAIDTAELRDFIESLPNRLDTIVSERGTSLSWGQKQRIMLARALAINPKILILDDFTARLDINTEKKILENVRKNYPDITLISVTQKIEPIKDYDMIILLMEGELLAVGKHEELMKKSLEYIQIYNSQLSTTDYELQA